MILKRITTVSSRPLPRAPVARRLVRDHLPGGRASARFPVPYDESWNPESTTPRRRSKQRTGSPWIPSVAAQAVRWRARKSARGPIARTTQVAQCRSSLWVPYR